MRWVLCVFALAACDRVFGIQALPAHPDAPAPFQKLITLTQDTGETLTGLPVSIAFTADPDLAAHAAADGGDIGFYAGDVQLPAEISSYADGSLDAWVQIPTLLPGTTTIAMGYGGGRVSRDASPWPSSAVGVWHASGAGAAMIDSTAHHHDVDIVAGSTAPALVPGVAGAARSFNGTTDRLCGTDSDHSLQFGKASFSFEMWVDVAQNLSGMDRPFTFGGSTASDTGFDFELGAGYWVPNVADGTTLLNVMAINGMLGVWVHLVGVVDREQGQLLFYEHGILRGMTAIPTTFGGIDMDRPVCFSGGLAKFAGAIDEVRIYGGALDAAWIRASYANLAERSGFVAIGPETQLNARLAR